ncbi:glycerophosphodiester phosphodiesterase family protein [Photobacterium halotolerans]|uniref:Glycerophosphoryl diester phosphodiesterase n=1 Tax=Photobacterium halotolerans TaxID=265726 RepID=A0A7X5AU50_9GAMM|nr:glycerophosphodiester phosphodiesterase family protein [Photobacterium halotolerans]NAW66046.1 glycerophosphoryl diester phosphodiesterase [Photobacterium halotolerans]NAW86701.1 glycerophosphoryl diester phosphodiesterase [Photobacterium halotolerans]
MISGHRGAAALAPENTLAGLQEAAKHQIQWVEMDTQLCADFIPVMFHDKKVNRCSNGHGCVRELNLAELKALDAGSWFSTNFVNERILTLDEALTACRTQQLKLNLEIKLHDEADTELLVSKVADTIAANGFPAESLILSSFSAHAVACCQQMMPHIRRGLICDSVPDDLMALAEKLELFSVHLDYRLLNETLASEIKQAGLDLHIWTMNKPELVAQFYQWGVDIIITDNPPLLLPPLS